MTQTNIKFSQVDATEIASKEAVNSAYLFGHNVGTSSGLTFGYYGGTTYVDGALTTISNGTLVLTASSTNYIETTRTGVISANTTGFTTGRIPLYTLVTNGSSITGYTDHRVTNYPLVGFLLKSVAGGTDVTLTAVEARNQIFEFTGTLTANINVIHPAIPGLLEIKNNTTGAYTLTSKTPSGTGVTVTQGKQVLAYCDGTNIISGNTDMYSFDGTAGWDDILAPLSSGKSTSPSDPDWLQLRDGIYANSFKPNLLNEAWVYFHISHSYAAGTVMYPHVHWTTIGTDTGVVRWGIEYTVAKGYNQQAFPATTTVYVEQAASGVPYQHMITEVSLLNAIPSTNLEIDGLILVRVFRDALHANDTCTDNAFGLFVDIHYQKAQFATKNKNYPFN